MFREISITVWLRVSKIHDVIVIFKSVRKRKGEIAALITRLVLSSVVVLVVAKIITASIPALNRNLIFYFFEIEGAILSFIGVNQNLHAVVIQTLVLDHIEHVELDFESFLNIGNSVEEPLSVTFRIDIILKHEIIFVF